jgi:tetratricopeptide (TPR) repeat protein
VSVPRLALLLCALASGFARADDLEAAARELFETGKDAYARADYPAALAAFREAFFRSRRPELLFNMAASLEELRRPHEAAEELRAYLRLRPDAADRTEIQARIAALEEGQRLIDQAHSAVPMKERPPIVATTPAESHRSRRPLWAAGGALLALGATSLAIGAGLEAAAQSAFQTLNAPPAGYVFEPDAQVHIQRFHPAGIVLLSVGGAAIVGGAAALLVGARR